MFQLGDVLPAVWIKFCKMDVMPSLKNSKILIFFFLCDNSLFSAQITAAFLMRSRSAIRVSTGVWFFFFFTKRTHRSFYSNHTSQNRHSKKLHSNMKSAPPSSFSLKNHYHLFSNWGKWVLEHEQFVSVRGQSKFADPTLTMDASSYTWDKIHVPLGCWNKLGAVTCWVSSLNRVESFLSFDTDAWRTC